MKLPLGRLTDAREAVRESVVAGVAFALPLLITAAVVGVAIEFVVGLLRPVVAGIRLLWSGVGGAPDATVSLAAMAAVTAAVVAVGFLVKTKSSRRAANAFHDLVGAVPGVGSVYILVRRTVESLFRSDSPTFREVKLVEYPSKGTYSFGFVTGAPPDEIREATGHGEVRTLFMPLAPNPILGGRVIYVPAEYTYDVDLTVEEAIRILVTSGVVSRTGGDS